MFTGKGMLHLVSGQEQRAKELLQKEMGGGAGEWGRALSSKYKQRPRGLEEYSPSADNPVLSGEQGAV